MAPPHILKLGEVNVTGHRQDPAACSIARENVSHSGSDFVVPRENLPRHESKPRLPCSLVTTLTELYCFHFV